MIFPTPKNNNKFGMHWLALQCSDTDRPDLEQWTREKMRLQKSWGAQWIKLISSPGGDTAWKPYGRGCSELSFAIAVEEGLWPIVRIYRGANGPYWTEEVEKNLRNLIKLNNGNPFYCEPANEVDLAAEWGGKIPKNAGEIICKATADFAVGCLNIGVVPLFPSVGYGGPGENYFETFHRVADPSLLDNMGIAVHNYAGALPIDWIRNDILIKGTPITQEEYNSYNKWCWDVGTPVYRSIEYVNKRRKEDAETFSKTGPSVWNYGFWTYEFCLQQLDALGHTKTPLILTEFGTRVGEMYDTLPRIDPNLHKTRTLDIIEACKKEERILGTSHWLIANQAWAGNSNNWEDQAWYSATLDPKVIPNLPWEEEIKTPGQLPVVDHLTLYPVNKNNGGEMYSKHKLGAHFQKGDTAALNKLPQDLSVVKSMDLDPNFGITLQAKYPNALRVCRVYVDNQDRYKTDPQGLINEIVNKFTPVAQYYTAIETGNEIINNSSSIEDAKAFDKYQVIFANTIWNKWPSMKVIGFNIATGNLGVDNELNLSNFPLSMQLPPDKFYVGCHSYSWERMSTSAEYYTLRYRKLAEGYKDHKFVITECGVTNAVVQSKPDVGWRTHGKEGQFIEDLVWFNSELTKDPYVVGSTVFNCGSSFGWDTFESTDQIVKAVNIISNQPAPTYETPIRVKIGDNIVTMELENYLRGVIPAEMPPYYHREALIAQTIAARTYAMHMIAHPRNKDFDIYSDARDQVFDPSKENAITNDIIRETKGQIILGVMGQYVKRCGLKQCPLCNGENGTNGAQWEGRMCQDGADQMAKDGKTAKDIIKYFYFYNEDIPVDDQSNQAKNYGVEIKLPNGIKPGDWYFKAVNVRHLPQEENSGNHHIYVDVLDKEGMRIYGSQVSVQDSFNNIFYAIIDKPLNEPGGNYPMFGHEIDPPNKRTVYVSQPNMLSEVVSGIHPAHPDEPPGNTLFHHSFSIIFKLINYNPVVEIPIEDIDEMRNIMWNNTSLGIPYNPDAAFPKKARELKLGVPMTTEIEYEGQVLQGYALGWLHCIKGDWSNIKQEEW